MRFGSFWGLVCLASLGMVCDLAGGTNAARETPALLSACEIDYPPFCYVDADGRPAGFSVELLRAAALAMGREATFQVGVWSEVKSLLRQGAIDALPLVGRTPERDEFFDFTFPYLSLHGAIVVRQGTTAIEDVEDLRGRRVGVMAGDNAEEFLRRIGLDSEIVTTPSFLDALRMLADGDCDAVIVQRLVALRLIQKHDLLGLHVLNRPVEGFRQDFSFAVQEEDRETLALLNEGLALIMADGTFRNLYARWFAALELPIHRRIVVGGDMNYPPYEFLDGSGRPAGYNVDLTRAIADQMGLDVEIRLGPWSEVRRGLERGTIDALQGMVYSSERAQFFDFSPAHAMVNNVAAVRRADGPPPANVDELQGKQLLVQHGDIMHDFALEQGLGAMVTTLDSHHDVLRELAAGRADCALVNRMTALYLITRHGWDDLSVGKQPLLVLEYCYAVPAGQRALLAQIGEGLKTLQESGEYRRIQEKWMGIYEETPLPLATVLWRAALIAGPLLLILAGTVAWTWSLRRQVARQTQEIRRRGAQFHSLVEGAPDSIFVQTEHRFAYINAAGLRLFGAESADQILGRPVLERVHPSVREIVKKRIRLLNEEKQAVPPLEQVWLRLGGGEVPVEVSAVPIAYGGKDGALVFAREISERKLAQKQREQLQDQLRQAQKLESVGRLAGGVAHDFNNMLGVILGHAELALEKVPADDSLRADIAEIHKAARHSAEVTHQLLAFARKQAIIPQVLDLNATVEGMLRMLRRLIGEDIELVWLPAGDLAQVKMDPAQVNQVLANLCVNARDAIHGTGRISIKTGQAVLDEHYCAQNPGFRPGRYVMLSVSDDGCGMDEQTLAKAFEPFFTTKDQTQGTGLGLAMIYGIVKQNSGFIKIYSELEHGTTIKIFLPPHAGPTASEPSSREIGPQQAQGETILVVEDEIAILDLSRKILQKLGYTVLTAALPADAVRLVKEHEGDIDLLMTDVVMPGMNGRDLADHLRGMRPTMRCLFMSGYTADVIAHQGVLAEGVQFIQKPFSMQELAEKVRASLIRPNSK